MGRDAANKWRGEFGDLSIDAKEIDGSIAGEMTAFEQDRDSVFLRECVGAFAMTGDRSIFSPSSSAASSRFGVISVASGNNSFS